MQLIPKHINGHKYWYLVQKGRKHGKVTNVKTIYLGTAERVAQLLDSPSQTAFPESFFSWEMGASAALSAEAHGLGLVELIDAVCGDRRRDAAISYGQLLTVLAIHRAIAPRALKSQDQLRTWYQGCGISQMLPMSAVGLDARRVDEALERLRAPDIDHIERRIVAAMVEQYHISLESLAFDGTNFDSYAQATTPSRLLRRGHAKSRRTNLRLLGLGLLVTVDEGLPLLSFVYPGNCADVRSFHSFLRRLKARQHELGMGPQTTLVCDGANMSQRVVKQMEAEHLHWVARLPVGHAPEADALPTAELPVVGGDFEQTVRAKKLHTTVYGRRRTVVAVYSASMHQTQLPGLQRDIRKATQDLDALRVRLQRQAAGKSGGRALTPATLRARIDKALERQHMRDLFGVEIGETGSCPSLSYQFRSEAWKHLEDYRLGRTVLLTDQRDWNEAQLVRTVRQQSHVEEDFLQLKDPEWASAVPLRHYTDPMLRVHVFTSVLALLLSKRVVRRLKQGGVKTTVRESLWQLSELRVARLNYGRQASSVLRSLARRRGVPPAPTARQQKMIQVLGLSEAFHLGPTTRFTDRAKSPTEPQVR